MNSFRLCALATIIAAAAACSSNNPGNDAGTGDASINDSGKKDSGLKDTGTGDDAGDDAAPIPTVDPLCAVPDAGGSGSCVTIDDASTTCNPVTNQGCDFADGGFACDLASAGFKCYDQPANTAAVCAACDYTNGPACLPGETCVPVDQQGTQKCARFCCTDNDCTGGHCDLTTLADFMAPAGVCVK